ncbi:MAG: hypothetical protein DI537_20570 [Stutzerimonas stutzeri]|nr:MAG: hypothetical protein DI537_20570 [Stutzerimonas stutzeri]
MIAEAKARLLVAGTPFALVEGTLALSQVKDRPAAMPAAYVFPVRSASAANQRATGGVLQETGEDFGVIIIFENLSAPVSDPATDELEQLYGWVRKQLVGFVIDGDHDPIEHISGELVRAVGGIVWWKEEFGTAHLLENDE